MVNYAVATLGLGLLLLLVGQAFVKKTGTRKALTWVGVVGIAVGAFAMYSPTTIPFLQTEISFGTLAVSTGTGTTGVVTTYQPTGSYSAKDKFSTTSVSGTAYYKVNDKAAATNAASNLNVGDVVTYWVDNSSGYYWVKPITQTAGASVTRFEAQAWQNGTATVSGYDLVGRNSLDTTLYNVSLGANELANIELTYQGTSKKSAMPFGGVFVVEYNSTISSVTCTGTDLLSSNPYHLTYTVSSTAHTYRTFGVSPTIDDGTASLRKITCQFINGGSPAGAKAVYYMKFIPANYYVDQNGAIVLDVEKFNNQDTTRTGSIINSPTFTGYWNA